MFYLKKNSEEDDGDGGGDKKLLAADVFRKSESQGERNCPSQATVGQTKLIFHVERDGAERVNDLGQDQDTWRGNGENNKDFWSQIVELRIIIRFSAAQGDATTPCLPRPLHTKAKNSVKRM